MSSRGMKRRYGHDLEVEDDQNVMETLSDADSDDDESDSDAETRKKNPLLNKFFDQWHRDLADIKDSKRKWNCPVCQNQYIGLQALMNHAKSISTKMKRHRDLASLMDEELQTRGTTVVPAGESFGKWKGLSVEEKDHEIVWPPMVVIRNTRHEKDEKQKVDLFLILSFWFRFCLWAFVCCLLIFIYLVLFHCPLL